MIEPINDLNSLKNIRSAANFLARVRLKKVDEYSISLDAHHFLLEKIHTQILAITEHTDIKDSSKRKENRDVILGLCNSSNTLTDSLKTKITSLLKEDIELGEEYLKKFVTLAGQIYVHYKVALLYLCGHIPTDSYNSNKGSVPTPDILLQTRKLIKKKGNAIESIHNAKTDIHHIDKQSYLGTSQEPLLIELERAFHNLLHKVTDNFEREAEISAFLEDKTAFRTKIFHLEERLGVFNSEYSDVLMSSVEEMEVFQNNPKGSEHFFEQYVEGIQPHFREVRNIYALEMTERMLKIAPYYMRNISEAKHYELGKYLKSDLYRLIKFLKTAMRQYKTYDLNEEEASRLFLIDEHARFIVDLLAHFNEKKPFQIRKNSPQTRQFHNPMKTKAYEEFITHIETTLTYLDPRLSTAKGERARCLRQFSTMLNITLVNTKNSLESNQVGEEYYEREQSSRGRNYHTRGLRKRYNSSEKPRQSNNGKRGSQRKKGK